MKRITVVFSIAGSMIGILSAVYAIDIVGADPAYSERLWAGWLALLLAGVTGLASLVIILPPDTSSLPLAIGSVMMIGGIAGFICINLFYINTLYGLAVPLWIAGAVLAFRDARVAQAAQAAR